MSSPRNRVNIIKDRYNSGLKIKRMWEPMYQLVGEYVMTRKQNFTSSAQPGEFLTEQLFSSVAPEANRTASSAILGNMWPNGARSFRIKRPRNIRDTAENQYYYETATSVMADAMDQPEAGLHRALSEYMMDQTSFGISGIYRRRTNDFYLPIRYSAINIKYMVIEENKDGEVDTVFIERELTVRQIVEEFGLDAVSARTREQYNNGDFLQKVKVLQLIEPRREGKFGFGNKSLPIASIHIELDANKILLESGFTDMPVIVARFLKALGETYARSPAMFAMPAILRLNLAWEIYIRASEKQADPPLYLLDNGALGGGIVDSSPGALSVFNVTGLGEKSPVGALYDTGPMDGLLNYIEVLTNDVAKAFYIDKLMDLNNESRMTLGEAQIRDRIRGESMSAPFRQQETELFSPLIRGTFNDLFDMGLLGVVKGTEKHKEIVNQGVTPLFLPPDIQKAIESGQRVYDIEYISPASRVMQTEELQGTTQFLDVVAGMAQGGMGESLDLPNVDKIVRRVAELTGTPAHNLRDSETIKKIREIRAQQMEQQKQAEGIALAADAGMKMAQAQSMREGAISGRPRG